MEEAIVFWGTKLQAIDCKMTAESSLARLHAEKPGILAAATSSLTLGRRVEILAGLPK